MSNYRPGTAGTLSSLQESDLKALLWLLGYAVKKTGEGFPEAAAEFGKRPMFMNVTRESAIANDPKEYTGVSFADHVYDLKMYAWLLGMDIERQHSHPALTPPSREEIRWSKACRFSTRPPNSPSQLKGLPKPL